MDSSEPAWSPADLERYRIPGIPDAMYYIPHFISGDEEAHILEKIPPTRWIPLSHRRLQAHPSPLTGTNVLLASPLPPFLTTPLLPRFEQLGLFADSPHKAPNHVLLNEYRRGQGIMPHEDGTAYWGCVATVSLEGAVVLDVFAKRREEETGEGGDGDIDRHLAQPHAPSPQWRILQEPGSLLITVGAAYTDLLHGIAETEIDLDVNSASIANWDLLGDKAAFVAQGGRNIRATRKSLTYRDVLKVSKVGRAILGRARG